MAERDGMSREEHEEYQKQMVEEKMLRDADYQNKKAERACLRSCIRDKYRIPKSERDQIMIEQAGEDLDVPDDMLKMVDPEAAEEPKDESIMEQMQNLPNMDMDQIKEKAQAAFVEMKSKAEEKCTVV